MTTQTTTLPFAAHPQRWSALLALLSGLLALGLDNTIVNIALPTLALTFGAGVSQLQLIVEAYALVFAGLLLTGGALSDRYGSRPVALVGVAIFSLATIGGSFASGINSLIAARAAMGIGGALLMPATLALIKQLFPPEERAQAIGLWTATSSLGMAGGPLVGGWLIEQFDWRAIFWFNLPLAAITLLGLLLFVPQLAGKRDRPLDLGSAVLSTLAIAALVLAIIEGPKWGWASPATLGLLLGGALLLGSFIWRSLRHPAPMLDLRLFANPRFSGASLSVALSLCAMAGLAFFLPQYLQLVLGFSPVAAGLRTLPLALAVMGSGLIGGWLASRLAARGVVTGGLLIGAAGLVLLALIDPAAGYLPVGLVMALIGFGVGLAYTAATDAVMAAVEPEQAGAAAAVNETAIELGNVLGVAIFGSALAAGYRLNMAMVSVPSEWAAQARDSLSGAVLAAEALGGESGQALLSGARQAFADAMSSVAISEASVALFAAAVAFWLLRPQRKRA